MKRMLLGGLFLAGLVASVDAQQAGRKLKATRIRGYVTEVTSPTNFEIEDYRITRDQGLVLDFDNASPDVTFKPEDIREPWNRQARTSAS